MINRHYQLPHAIQTEIVSQMMKIATSRHFLKLLLYQLTMKVQAEGIFPMSKISHRATSTYGRWYLQKNILINTVFSESDQIKTLGHEVGHILFVLLGKCFKKSRKVFKKFCGQGSYSREAEEQLVEAFADAWVSQKRIRLQLQSLMQELNNEGSVHF